MAKDVEPVMSTKAALDGLQALAGLRAAFLGFPQAVAAVTPLLHKLAQVEAEIVETEKAKEKAIEELHELKDAHAKALEYNNQQIEAFAKEKLEREAEKQKWMDDIAGVEKEYSEARETHAHRLAVLDKEYNDLDYLVNRLRSEYDTFRTRVGLTITNVAAETAAKG